MITVKDLFENEELMNNITEDIEDIPEDTEVFYAVWALGYTKDNLCTDDEVLVGEFTDPDAAVAYADTVDLNMIREFCEGEADSETAYFSIEVETVVGDPDDEDGGTINIGTIYCRDLWLDGEYGSEEDVPANEYSVVAVSGTDYEILTDGTLKLKAEFMQGFEVNDMLRVQFLDEPDVDLLTYMIVSKTDNCYQCELML